MAKKYILIVGGIAATVVTIGGVLYYRHRRDKSSGLKKKIDQLMQVLDQPNIYIRDPAIVRQTLRTMANDGADNLQVLSDFDRTLSKYWIDGKHGESCHGVIEKASVMPKEFQERVAAIKAKFYPMEMSPDLTREEKVPLMVEWWTNVHEAMINSGLKREWLMGMVSEAAIELRDGTKEFLEMLSVNKIPVVIFSAGVGDVIDEVLASAGCLMDGLRVISNYMDFNESGQLVGFKTELIHSYNKHEISVHWNSYFDKDRPNDILLGDTIGDTSMADGLDKGGTILKIAFLNDNVDSLLPSYQAAYDVVICEDQTMDTVTVLVKGLLT